MLAPQPEAAYQLVRDLPLVLWTTSQGHLGPQQVDQEATPQVIIA